MTSLQASSQKTATEEAEAQTEWGACTPCKTMEGVKVYVLLDGVPLPHRVRGKDVVEDAFGRTYISVLKPRLYFIVSEYVSLPLRVSSLSRMYHVECITSPAVSLDMSGKVTQVAGLSFGGMLCPFLTCLVPLYCLHSARLPSLPSLPCSIPLSIGRSPLIVCFLACSLSAQQHVRISKRARAAAGQGGRGVQPSVLRQQLCLRPPTPFLIRTYQANLLDMLAYMLGCAICQGATMEEEHSFILEVKH